MTFAVDIPHPKNFCGGNFQDWLEVMLVEKCNGCCEWCIEKNGWTPTHRASWREMVDAILSSGKANIVLLGGEPTLYPDIANLVRAISGKTNVFVTTNGGRLTPAYVKHNLAGIAGVNVSIHHYGLRTNQRITGIVLRRHVLAEAFRSLHDSGATVRLNCNVIRGRIDSDCLARRYVDFCKALGADSVRFAELKDSTGSWVGLTEVFGHQYGLNDDPFTRGCNTNAIVDGMSVNFRQMCGLQAPEWRPIPKHPKQENKVVLYCDANFYRGWQRKERESAMEMDKADVEKAFRETQDGTRTADEAKKWLFEEAKRKRLARRQILTQDKPGAGGCHY